jgi:hypothetical protein
LGIWYKENPNSSRRKILACFETTTHHQHDLMPQYNIPFLESALCQDITMAKKLPKDPVTAGQMIFACLLLGGFFFCVELTDVSATSVSLPTTTTRRKSI